MQLSTGRGVDSWSGRGALIMDLQRNEKGLRPGLDWMTVSATRAHLETQSRQPINYGKDWDRKVPN